MSRINRTNVGGEKASSIPLKKSYCGHQKYINICTFVILKKKDRKPPWHLVVGFLKLR